MPPSRARPRSSRRAKDTSSSRSECSHGLRGRRVPSLPCSHTGLARTRISCWFRRRISRFGRETPELRAVHKSAVLEFYQRHTASDTQRLHAIRQAMERLGALPHGLDPRQQHLVRQRPPVRIHSVPGPAGSRSGHVQHLERWGLLERQHVDQRRGCHADSMDRDRL